MHVHAEQIKWCYATYSAAALQRCRIAQAAAESGHIHILLWLQKEGLLLQLDEDGSYSWRCLDGAAANGHLHVLRCVSEVYILELVCTC
jgi:hypothetical protein